MAGNAILVTGGAGYIGSHTCVELLQEGFELVVLDDLSNSKPEALQRVQRITGKSVAFIEGDVRDRAALRALFSKYDIGAVIHFAGLKAVGESAQIPLQYYDVNVSGSIALAEVMAEFDCQRIVFSSSATVYSPQASVPYVESYETGACNVYGRSKLMVEQILRDACDKPDSRLQATLLRYFNPIGAHESGLIGEDPQGIPNNLLPYVAQVAVGRLSQVQVFGDDYPTPDGTGVRDYIHVVDLARGHLHALQALQEAGPGCRVYNLGGGQGSSVLDVIAAFEKTCGKKLPVAIKPRRAGDIAVSYADASLALAELNWQTERDLETMVTDTWRWQSANPNGFCSE